MIVRARLSPQSVLVWSGETGKDLKELAEVQGSDNCLGCQIRIGATKPKIMGVSFSEAVVNGAQ